MTAGKSSPGSGPVSGTATTHDAVVVVPGIMGSELVETATGDVMWGLAPSPFVSAWLSGASLDRLHLSGDEREGRYGRVFSPGGLARVPRPARRGPRRRHDRDAGLPGPDRRAAGRPVTRVTMDTIFR
jgi:hypothetical protein